MMRDDTLNSHVYPVRTKMTAPSTLVCSKDESELQEFLMNENLSQICSTDKDESKGIIVEKCSTEEDKSKTKGIIINQCDTEENKSDFVIN